MTQKSTSGEEHLSAALRELAESSSQSASPELGAVLKDAFRRHHLRRKRMLRIRLSVVCLCLIGLALWLLPRKSQSPPKAEPAVVHAIPPRETSPAPVAHAAVPDAHAASTRRHAAPRKTSLARNSRAAPEAFVALPASAMLSDDDELRVVRVEMPGEDLRLVGAPVTERMVRHRVMADFVVGHDGTPYAVRLVQARY